MRAFALCCAAFVAAQTLPLRAQGEGAAPLSLLDVPFISQSEALCGGAAAAMVLRYWGERGVSAETFAHLVDRSAAGIRTDAWVAELRNRGWTAAGGRADERAIRRELDQGRPVVTLIEDRPSTFHYVVVVGWHERGVVLHDPARAPFVVMSTPEFDRRWRAADRWMGVVVPGEDEAPANVASAFRRTDGRLKPAATDACDQVVAQGVQYAQSKNLDAAERILAASVACPGAARELAGVRVLQKRWSEASDLASTAVASDAGDIYAWQVLATSRFVQNDPLGALKAWNHAAEPRLDLVRVDGLTRTRYRVVEQLIEVRPGELLTPERFLRARRRLGDLPAATTTRVDYLPVPSGLAELRAVVSERPVVPSGRVSLAALGLVAVVTREVRVTTGSIAGGGEAFSGAWRFWTHRRRFAASAAAPAPWGGVWTVDGLSERQAFDTDAFPTAERVGAHAGFSDWATSRVRWQVRGGVDEWSGAALRPAIGGRLHIVARDDRVQADAGVDTWFRDDAFTSADFGMRARSSTGGLTFVGAARLQVATDAAPLDLWWGGDTGHARSTLLRAHPLLDDGRLRHERLGRALLQGSLEAQRWWTVAGPVRAAAAVFGDAGRTAWKLHVAPQGDVDVGVGVRLALTGLPGVFRADVGKGLRDGATAFSVVYEP